jgi:hypothetical protein
MTNHHGQCVGSKIIKLFVVIIIHAVPLIVIHGSNTWMVYAQPETPPSLPTDDDKSADGRTTTAGSSPSLMEAPKPSTPTDDTTTTQTKPTTITTDSFNVKDHMDWGSYYDPKNIFCGQYDCYRILGFDYESYGTQKPDAKIITKRYRALSREWHPDKSKHRNAKERFVVS